MNQFAHVVIGVFLFNLTFHLFLKRSKFMQEKIKRLEDKINDYFD